MPVGAYSAVRYSDHLSDQRINLGVLVWHPLDGILIRISPSLDRVHAVDPRVKLTPIKEQIDFVRNEIQSMEASRGMDKLKELSMLFREGLEITAPYPARIQSLDEMVEHLYEKLVSPVAEFRRASSQRQFERSFRTHLERSLKSIDPRSRYRYYGQRRLNGVSVEIGHQTLFHQRKILWRALSLQAVPQADAQIARAKATALDIDVVRGIPEFRQHRQFVAVQEPKASAAERFKDSVAWLKRTADDVLIVHDRQSLETVIPHRLRTLV